MPTAPPAIAAVTIDELRFTYPGGEFVLNVPKLEIEPGARLAVVGPSGSGKTTLLHLIAGVFLPQQGRVRVGDMEVSGLGDQARRDFRISQVGFVFQDFELLDYLNVLENVLLPYRLNRTLRLDADVRAAARSLAGQLGIADKLHRPIRKLSQGERQRVAICRALLPKPKLLLADEPTGNLDPANSRRIVDLLLERARAHDATLICVTHDHTLLDGFDRVVDFEDFREAA